MKTWIKENWKTALLLLESGFILFMFGRGFEGRLYTGLVSENTTLRTIKANTETTFSKYGTPELKNVMRQLGYSIVEPAKADTTKK